ncbi:TPA: hypothetical protein ACJJ9K_000828 [Neisseria meningitidis]
METQPHPLRGVSDGIAAGNVRRLRQRRTQKTVCLHLQQSDRYRRRAFAVFFPNRLQVPPIRRVMPPPFKGNARVNGFAVGREAGVRCVSWGIENITMQKENFSIIRQDSLTDS